MRNHQPCCVAIPGHDPERRRVQPQTGCAGRNRVTIRILGADRVRTHVPGTLGPRGCGPLPLPHIPHPGRTTQQRARTVTAGAPPMTAAGVGACRPLTVEPKRSPPTRPPRRCSAHVPCIRSVPFRQDLDLSRAGFARRISARLNPVSCAGVQPRWAPKSGQYDQLVILAGFEVSTNGRF